MVRNEEGEMHTYRTIESLSSVGADVLMGPGTRVWIVRRLENGVPTGDLCVLKDTWIHHDRRPEHGVLADIKAKRPDCARYFLTCMIAGFVPASKDHPDELGSATAVHCRGRKLVAVKDPTRLMPSLKRERDGGSLYSVGLPRPVPGIEYRGKTKPNLHPRRHYRIVFEEVGVPIHDLRNYDDVWTALEGGIEGECTFCYSMPVHARTHHQVYTSFI